ncbi:zinc knuckle CX2CX4HX4C containing protein [Tanacetum coccineum]
MSNTSDKGTTFGDVTTKVGMQLRSSPKVSTSSSLVSPSSIINVPRDLYSIDVAATFGVPLTTVGDLQKLIYDIDAGKHDELLSELTNEDRMETLEALGSICNSIKIDHNNADVIPCKVSYADDSINLNVDESTIPNDPIIQSVDINKSTFYAGVAGGSAKDQPNVNSNFRTLVVDPVFDGVNIFIPRKVVEKASFSLNLIPVLEGGPWLIRKSLIILKKWSMDTRLLKEELTRIPIWVKLHDGRSSFPRCSIEVNSEADLVEVVTIGIPSISEDDFTKETIRVEYKWRPHRCDTCKIFGHVHDYCPKKVVTPPIVATSNVVTLMLRRLMIVSKRWTTGNSSKKDNLSMSNSFSALNEEEEDDEEDVENVYDESANLFQNTEAGGSLSFTTAAVSTYTTTFGLFPGEYSGLSPSTCRWGYLSSTTSRWGKFTGESSPGIRSPATIPNDKVGPTCFSVKQLVPPWHTFSSDMSLGNLNVKIE